jgi:hypothetical protein
MRSISVIGILAATFLAGDGPVVKTQGFLPFADAPIHYRTSEGLVDPIAKLQRKLEQGEVQLTYEAKNGYLQSVLKELGISINSQMLVFSKTSFQYPYIKPSSPRALYFNDDVYVGQVHRSKSLEFVSFDPNQGAIFYILSEQKVDRPRFERAQLDCIQCHVASTTRGVPGVMVRSVLTNANGYPKAGAAVRTTGHESPISERWGGWYVTGTIGQQAHQGNTIINSAKQPAPIGIQSSIDASRYLTDFSDIVAHLVLAHQTQMHNLITETNYRYRLGFAAGGEQAARQQFEKPAEALIRYLLFASEARLDEPVFGSSKYAGEFAALGPRDAQGRSLRDFDLQKRIFKYPCSYLIYSEAFDAIPGPAKEYIYRRLLEVLTGRDQSPDFASLTAEDRTAILQILVATKLGLPEEWKQFAARQEVMPIVRSARR